MDDFSAWLHRTDGSVKVANWELLVESGVLAATCDVVRAFPFHSEVPAALLDASHPATLDAHARVVNEGRSRGYGGGVPRLPKLQRPCPSPQVQPLHQAVITMVAMLLQRCHLGIIPGRFHARCVLHVCVCVYIIIISFS